MVEIERYRTGKAYGGTSLNTHSCRLYELSSGEEIIIDRNLDIFGSQGEQTEVLRKPLKNSVFYRVAKIGLDDCKSWKAIVKKVQDHYEELKVESFNDHYGITQPKRK